MRPQTTTKTRRKDAKADVARTVDRSEATTQRMSRLSGAHTSQSGRLIRELFVVECNGELFTEEGNGGQEEEKAF